MSTSDLPANAEVEKPSIKDCARYAFADGDVYILSGPDPDEQKERTRYKLHKRMLSAFAVAFDDMFSLASERSAEIVGTAEQPDIELAESAEVLEAIWSFIYANRGLGTYDIRAQSTSHLTLVARACDKYQIASMQNAVETYLAEYLEGRKRADEDTADYDPDFDIPEIVALFGHAHSTNNKELMELASDAVIRLLGKDNQSIAHIPLTDLETLSGRALHALWSAQYEKACATHKEEEEGHMFKSSCLEKSARWVNFLLHKPAVESMHAMSACYSRDVVPFWSETIVQLLDNPPSWAVTPANPSAAAVVSALKKGNYGNCVLCKEAIGKKYAEILAWK